MKVTLVNHTPLPLETLIFTKSTRLKMSSTSLDEIILWPEEKKLEELQYMLGTIKSSWEFVDFIFLIEDVSRAFTHQLVRHRIGTSFAQQSQRTVDMSDFNVVTPEGIASNCSLVNIYELAMNAINGAYEELLENGAAPEDARGVLPTNICTNIIFKANLRTLNQMCAERLCVKAQGEFQSVMQAIRAEVIKALSWTEPMLRVHCASTGVCCFPTYQKCPIKPFLFNPETGKRFDEIRDLPATKTEIQYLWERNIQGGK